MTKARSGPHDEDDIVTPSAHSTATDKAGPGLRMPPIIDISPSFGLRLLDGAKNLLRGTLYQASLIALLLMALGLTVLTLMQAGNIKTPDWRQLAASLEGMRGEAAAPAIEVPLPQAGVSPPLQAQPEAIAPPPETKTAREVEQVEQAEVPPSAADASAPPALPLVPHYETEMQAEMDALRQTLADTRRDLAAAQAALLEKQTATSGTELAQLTKRATLAELLLRLDDGVAFDDLLDGGRLDDVLYKNELAALALHAARGVPTEAGIRAQAETLPLIISGAAANGTVDNQLPAMLGWLAAKAPKLISIRQSPMAGAQKQLRVLYEQLQARDYRAAAATTRLLVLTHDDGAGAPEAENKPMLALQALYADLRAFSETRAARNDLRRDYIAGVRP